MGDPAAAERLAAARQRVTPPPRPHTGTWDYHDDDCMCGAYGRHCNRDGHVWSCCGACREDTECTAPELHPTHWNYRGPAVS